MSLATERAREQAAQARYDHASAALDNARIRARLAEIREQHEPLQGLLESKMTPRDRLYAAAFYVVVGRMPDDG